MERILGMLEALTMKGEECEKRLAAKIEASHMEMEARFETRFKSQDGRIATLEQKLNSISTTNQSGGPHRPPARAGLRQRIHGSRPLLCLFTEVPSSTHGLTPPSSGSRVSAASSC